MGLGGEMNRFRLGIAACVLGMQLAACTTAPPVTASPEDVAAGAELWGHRCRGCHEPGFPGIPVKAELAGKKPAYVAKALTTGKMKDIAGGLTEIEIRQIAAFVTQPQTK